MVNFTERGQEANSSCFPRWVPVFVGLVRFCVDNVTYVENVFAVKKPDQFPGFSIRIIPSATSLFNVAKLSMSRNNVRSVTAGNAVCFKRMLNSTL